MADANATQLTGPFGAERVPVPGLPDAGLVPQQGNPVQPQTQTVPFTDETLRDQPGFAEAFAAREHRANTPDTPVLVGALAAMSQWASTKAIDRFGRPSFEGEQEISQYDYLQHTPLVLDKDERDYFMDVGKGEQSAQYAIDRIKADRLAKGVIGEHPLGSTLVAFGDPAWLAIGALKAPRALATGIAGRTLTGVLQAGVAGGVVAAGEGPVSDSEIAMSMLMAGMVGAAVHKPGVGLVPADPEFPAKELKASVDAMVPNGKPRLKLIAPAEREAPRTYFEGAPTPEGQKPRVVPVTEPEGRITKEAVYEEVPAALQPGAVNSDAKVVADAVDTAINQDARARGVGEMLQWNMRKKMASFSDVGKEVSDLIYDNNSDMSRTSIEAHREAIMSDLRPHQFKYEEQLRAHNATEGYGTVQMVNPGTSRAAYANQARIEKDVQRELYRREQATRIGEPLVPMRAEQVPVHITKMADAVDELSKAALAETKRAGVKGAEGLEESPGYLHRKWSSYAMDQVLARMDALGIPRDAAMGKLKGLVSMSIRRANKMEAELADKIGGIIVDRAMSKGYFEDSIFQGVNSEGRATRIREILKESGMVHNEIDKLMMEITGGVDEAGKAGFLKHRLEVDYKATLRVGDEDISIMDLIDSRVSTILDQYVSSVSTRSAFARKGLGAASDIQAVRSRLTHSITDEGTRAKATRLFDRTIAHFMGDPAGQELSENFRLAQAYSRATTLAWSGLWQATEYSNIAAEYTLLKTLKYAIQEIPGFKQLIQEPTRADARSLNNVLSQHSSASMRMRPYLSKFEDGYEMSTKNAMQLSTQTMGQMVPYANGMKYVHHNQANIVGNLILDRLQMAANGNTKARAALAKYGLESHVMDRLAAEIKQHGFIVDDWSNKLWDEVRPAFAKMMDTAVLKGRLGDMPEFAAFDQVGKFIFTYRSFVLVAHNKTLAGGLARNGVSGVALVMLYQLPLTLAAVQAQNVLSGKGTLDNKQMFAKAMGQMGGLGMFSEPLKWATGESNAIGAPGLSAVDRGVKLFQAGAQLDPQQGMSAAISLMPVFAASPVSKVLDGLTRKDH